MRVRGRSYNAVVNLDRIPPFQFAETKRILFFYERSGKEERGKHTSVPLSSRYINSTHHLPHHFKKNRPNIPIDIDSTLLPFW